MLPAKVNIVEVGARDGLQNETAVTLVDKIRLINQLSSSGLKHIEAGSFVSPRWVPQMADSDQVFAGISKKPDVVYSALTPNLAGLERALESGVKRIAVFGSASETFSQKNINCSITESLARFEPVIELANQHNIPVRGYLSCTMVCPYEGVIKPEQTTKVANTLFDMGCYEISLGDTVGKATPNRVIAMLDSLLTLLPKDALAVHFHDTYGQALANIYQALLMASTPLIVRLLVWAAALTRKVPVAMLQRKMYFICVSNLGLKRALTLASSMKRVGKFAVR